MGLICNVKVLLDSEEFMIGLSKMIKTENIDIDVFPIEINWSV